MKKYIDEGRDTLAAYTKSTAGPSASISRAGVHLLNAYIACSWQARFAGLFAYPALSSTDALVLSPCFAIHTVGLNATIDVAFMNPSGQILKCCSVRPFSIAMCWKACRVVEMMGGTAHRLNLSVGQHLVLERRP